MNSTAPPHDPALTALVIDNIDRAVIALDRHGLVTLFNPAAENYLGLSARHALGRPCQELFAGQEAVLYLVRTALAEGRSITDDESVVLQRPKNEPLPVSIYAAPIFSRRGEQDGAVLILRDLSRVRELEDTLRRTDQLAMLTTLAAGLAHEIKNPLGGIKGAAQLLAMELAKDSPLQEYTRVMIKETERVNGIIEELMDLGKPRPAVMGEVDLTKILGDIVLLQVDLHILQARVDNVATRGLVKRPGQSFAELYLERIPFYRKNAEYIYDCGEQDVESVSRGLVSLLRDQLR